MICFKYVFHGEGFLNRHFVFSQFLGSEVDLSDKLGRTPLHYAASFVHSKLLSVLLNKGCTVDKQDTNGCTPLHYAAAATYDDVA